MKQDKIKAGLFYEFAGWLSDRIEQALPASVRARKARTYAELYVGKDAEALGREDRIKRTKGVLTLVLASVVLIILVAVVREPVKSLLSDGKIHRPETAYGRKDVTLNWIGEGEEGRSAGRIDLTVREQMPEEAGINAILDYAERYLNELYPNGQPVAGEINFLKTIPGTVIELTWEPSDYTWISYDGTPTSKERPEEGIVQEIRVTMLVYNQERTVLLYPLLVNKEAEEIGFERKLRAYLLAEEADTKSLWIELPEEFDGVKLKWKTPADRTIPVLVGLTLVAAFAVALSGVQKRRNHLKLREKEMLNDYPELVSKLLLLLEAGLTMRGAWERMVNNYRKSGQNRFVYEEMCITLREIENGYSEVNAFERFGKRCRLLPYLRFSGLLEQNLVKGSRSVIPMLEQEALNAFEERKETAKRLGEEAGTKLLIPMAGMLFIVLVMIMFPAFQNI